MRRGNYAAVGGGCAGESLLRHLKSPLHLPHLAILLIVALKSDSRRRRGRSCRIFQQGRDL